LHAEPRQALSRRGPRDEAGPGERRSPRPASFSGCGVSSAAGLADLGADVAEGVVGVGAEGGDRRDADDDDQGEHDRVLDRRRAVLVPKEVDRVLAERALCASPQRGVLGGTLRSSPGRGGARWVAPGAFPPPRTGGRPYARPEPPQL